MKKKKDTTIKKACDTLRNQQIEGCALAVHGRFLTAPPETKKPEWVRYCTHCGREMVIRLIGAETAMQYYGDTKTIPVGGAYNYKTGARQYVRHYTCPQWKDKLFSRSKHDTYFKDEIITETKDIMELWKYQADKVK